MWMQETGVVLGLEDSALQEEVLHFLDRLPRIRVLSAASDPSELARRVRDARPEAVVVSPGLAANAPDLDGASILVVAPTETTAALRSALTVGAVGFYLWPEERDGLARDAQRAARPPRPAPGAAGRVVAVHGPRGGAGCTFVATNLAAACAERHSDTVLVDLDRFGADVTVALGLDSESNLTTTADLVPVSEELTEEHVDRVLHPHPRGFRVLPAPSRAGTEALPAAGVSSMVRLLRRRFDAVVLHLPRAVDGPEVAAIEASDVVLLVMTLDVLGVRAGRRTVDLLAEHGLEGRCRMVLNRASRGEIVPADVQRVLNLPLASVIRDDRSVPRAQNRGELVVGRGSRSARRIGALAEAVLQEAAE
jgi:Flp pilus assembly CpaE family ATPase